MNHTVNQTINQTVIEQTKIMGIAPPFTSSYVLDIYIITLIVALAVTLINKYLTDQTKIKALRKEMKDLQKKMRSEMTKNPEKAQQMQKDLMKKNMENMKQSMNPKIMLATMLPLLIVISFVSQVYGPYGQFFNLGFTTFGWLGTYITFSIINSLLLKKVLDVS